MRQDDDDLAPFMESLQLQAYLPAMLDGGYSFVSDIKDLGAQELQEEVIVPFGFGSPQTRRLRRHLAGDGADQAMGQGEWLPSMADLFGELRLAAQQSEFERRGYISVLELLEGREDAEFQVCT